MADMALRAKSFASSDRVVRKVRSRLPGVMRWSVIGFSVFSLLSIAQVIPIKPAGAIPLELPKLPAPVLKLNDPLPANLFVELAKAINPSVVNISTSAVYKPQANDPMREMLEKFYGITPEQNNWNNKPQRIGLGTGFIIREDGLIITNAHVLRDADIIEVQLTENAERQYKAELIGSDARTDIALIKIKPDVKLKAVSLGASKDVEVGEWVAAFGNPYGHGHTMTKGVISSKGRAIQEINKFPLLQTDASINPGNSGGPLVNSKGQVIGINSAIDARAQGIGFAIPIDEVKTLLPALERGESLRRGYLGVDLQDVPMQLVRSLDFDENYTGSWIANTLINGPAEKAGLRPNDIVTEIDDKKIRNAQDLMDRISDLEPGKKIKLKFLRNNRGEPVAKTATVTIGARPNEKELLKSKLRRNR